VVRVLADLGLRVAMVLRLALSGSPPSGPHPPSGFVPTTASACSRLDRGALVRDGSAEGERASDRRTRDRPRRGELPLTPTHELRLIREP
jgi:hypothetical protein